MIRNMEHSLHIKQEIPSTSLWWTWSAKCCRSRRTTNGWLSQTRSQVASRKYSKNATLTMCNGYMGGDLHCNQCFVWDCETDRKYLDLYRRRKSTHLLDKVLASHHNTNQLDSLPSTRDNSHVIWCSDLLAKEEL